LSKLRSERMNRSQDRGFAFDRSEKRLFINRG
jgi:hypothetical protein